VEYKNTKTEGNGSFLEMFDNISSETTMWILFRSFFELQKSPSSTPSFLLHLNKKLEKVSSLSIFFEADNANFFFYFTTFI
jgi:hypothetical protein